MSIQVNECRHHLLEARHIARCEVVMYRNRGSNRGAGVPQPPNLPGYCRSRINERNSRSNTFLNDFR